MYRIAKVSIQRYIMIWYRALVPTPFPEWKSLSFPYIFLLWWPIFPTNFAWNCLKYFFTYREYFKILDTKSYGFLTILVLSVVKYPTFCFNKLSYIFSKPLKKKNSLHFLTFWPIPQPFPTLSANSLAFQGLKKSDSWLFQDFAYTWEPCIL